jgi:hypothetical protein
VLVLELKTGKPLAEHRQQLDVYIGAARALFPGASVEGRLIYAHGGTKTAGHESK